MDNQYRMLMKRAGWLLDHGYVHGDIHAIAENLKQAEEKQKLKNSDK